MNNDGGGQQLWIVCVGLRIVPTKVKNDVELEQ